jgi:hypothetical protein
LGGFFVLSRFNSLLSECSASTDIQNNCPKGRFLSITEIFVKSSSFQWVGHRIHPIRTYAKEIIEEKRNFS